MDQCNRNMFLWISFTFIATGTSSAVEGKACGTCTTIGRRHLAVFLFHNRKDVSSRIYTTNTGTTSVQVNISTPLWPGDERLQLTLQLEANETKSVEIPDVFRLTLNNQIDRDKALLIESNGDITVVALNPGYHSSDAFKLLPVSVLGTKYIAAAFQTTPGSASTYGDNSEIAVVAFHDDTSVTFSLSAQCEAVVEIDGKAYHAAGVSFIHNSLLEEVTEPITVQLRKYEVFQIWSLQDLTGTLIQSNKPIAVFSGNVNNQINGGSFDHIADQIPPVSTWGKSVVTAPVMGSVKEESFKVIAGHDNTTVSIATSIKTVSVVLDEPGQFHHFVAPIGSSVTVSASSAVMLVQYGASMELSSSLSRTSDEFMLVVAPTEQYQSSHSFMSLDYLIEADSEVITLFVLDGNLETVTLNGQRISETSNWTQISGSNVSYVHLRLDEGMVTLSSSVATGKMWGYVHGSAYSSGYAFSIGANYCGIEHLAWGYQLIPVYASISVPPGIRNYKGSHFEMTMTDLAPADDQVPLLTVRGSPCTRSVCRG